MDARPEAVLTPLQRDILRAFGTVRDSRVFYLSGASALAAFYTGHRRSNDLDLFTDVEPLIEPASDGLVEALTGSGMECQPVRRYRTFAEYTVRRREEATRVELVRDSPFHLDPRDLTYEGVRIDSFRDLAANKLQAAFGRAEPRDLVDIYVLVRDGHCPFEDLLVWASEKDPGLDAYFLAQSLQTVEALPDDVNRLPVELLVELDTADMKRTLTRLARDLLERGLPRSRG